ncbi:MAG: hypothetical protein IT275_12415, partial [Chitinophagales bacterium]|nr:hypothetical protein [Chitinophagales bacterium]
MKKIITLFTLIMFYVQYSGKAQTDSSIFQKSEFIIEHLNKNNIPSGILYDMVVPFAQLTLHNGQNDSAVCSPLQFQQAYFEFYQSAFIKQPFVTPDSIIDNIINNYSRATHPLGLLFMQYATIKSDAIANGLLTLNNGQLFNVQGAASPYDIKESFVASPLTNGEHMDIGTHTFILDEAFILGNNFKPIKKIKLTLLNSNIVQERNLAGFAINQFHTITPFEFEFDTTGLYIFNIEVEFMDSTLVHTKAAFNVVEGSLYGTNNENKRNSSLCDTCITMGGINGGDTLVVTGNNYDMSAYGASSTPVSGIAYIFYATNNNGINYTQHRVKKPIIFLDGFDPSNSRDAPRIYSRYINKKFYINGGDVYLADYLRSLGYDLIILDFDDGGTYIEKNAMVVNQLLQQLYNTHKNWLQKDFVVIGPSMGALIGQFALAYMESNNIPHHTRTFISFDGPHQGANVAFGMQTLVEYALQSGTLNLLTGFKLSEIKNGMYNGNAAKQMIVHHVSSGSILPVANSKRSTFLNNLASVGNYAQGLRNVAIINGNKSAATNPDVTYYFKLIWLKHHLHIPMQIIPNPFHWWWPPIIIPPTNQDIDWKVYGTSNAGTEEVAKLFTLWPLGNLVGGIPFGMTKKYSSCAPLSFSYDECQGSNFGVDFTGEQDILKKYIGWLPFNQIDLSNLNKFTFIPTVSAADYIQGNPLNISADLTNITLTKCAGTTPFDKVYANNYRTDHVAVDDPIAEAFLNEILDINAGLKITGNFNIYTLGNSIFGGLPRNFTASGGEGTYTWAYTGNWSTSQSGVNNNTFSINQVFDYNGGTIQVNDGCNTVSQQIKFVSLDNPVYNGGSTTLGKVTLFPNPAGNTISLDVDSDIFDPTMPSQILILDMNGNTQMQNTYANARELYSISVSN